MNLEPYSDDTGMKVWLSTDEIEQLLATDALEAAERQLAIALGVRCGLRSQEVLDVAPKDCGYRRWGDAPGCGRGRARSSVRRSSRVC